MNLPLQPSRERQILKEIFQIALYERNEKPPICISYFKEELYNK